MICGVVAIIILLWFFSGLVGCKTTKTATRTVTDTVRVVRVDSVAVSKDTETVNKQDEFTRITERYLPGLPLPSWPTDTSIMRLPLPIYSDGWRNYYEKSDNDPIIIRTPPQLIERIIERGSSQMQWQKINYDSIIRVAVDSLAATKTETVKAVEKWRMPWWWVLVIISGLFGMFFIIYSKR